MTERCESCGPLRAIPDLDLWECEVCKMRFRTRVVAGHLVPVEPIKPGELKLEELKQHIVDLLFLNAPSFGGGRDSDMNPIAHALKDKPPMFAAGVAIRPVVELVINMVAVELEARGYDCMGACARFLRGQEEE